MQVCVEAYDCEGQQILGNLDGQTSWKGRDYRKTFWYKELPNMKTLNNRVKFYQVVTGDDLVLETIQNRSHS